MRCCSSPSSGLPPLGWQLLAPVPRLDADAVEYFSHLRSLYFDHDLDFANEFAHFGILTRGDKVAAHRHRPSADDLLGGTRAPLDALLRGGRPRGPPRRRTRGRLLALPHPRGVPRPASPTAWPACCSSSLLLRARSSARRSRLWTSVLLLYATFLLWYVVYEPAMSHALSFFAAALALFVWWHGAVSICGRAAPSSSVSSSAWPPPCAGRTACCCSCPRQPAPGLARPATERDLDRWSAPAPSCSSPSPWAPRPSSSPGRRSSGSTSSPTRPHGRDFLRLGHPFLLNTFFSSRHGLLYWTPVLWGGFLGLVGALPPRPLHRPRPGRAAPRDELRERLLGRLVGGGQLLEPALRLRPAPPGPWASARRSPGSWRRSDGVPWPWPRAWASGSCSGTSSSSCSTARGRSPPTTRCPSPRSPATTPSSWAATRARPWPGPPTSAFAQRHDLPAARYDLMVGKYLFYRQNNLGGLVKVGDGRADPALFAGDWSAPLPCGECSLPRGPGPGAGDGAARRAGGPRPDGARARRGHPGPAP